MSKLLSLPKHASAPNESLLRLHKVRPNPLIGGAICTGCAQEGELTLIGLVLTAQQAALYSISVNRALQLNKPRAASSARQHSIVHCRRTGLSLSPLAGGR
jgi:hypothetical protein